MKITIENEDDNEKAIQSLETLGDLECFQDTPELVRLFDALIDAIELFEKENYPMS